MHSYNMYEHEKICRDYLTLISTIANSHLYSTRYLFIAACVWKNSFQQNFFLTFHIFSGGSENLESGKQNVTLCRSSTIRLHVTTPTFGTPTFGYELHSKPFFRETATALYRDTQNCEYVYKENAPTTFI